MLYLTITSNFENLISIFIFDESFFFLNQPLAPQILFGSGLWERGNFMVGNLDMKDFEKSFLFT